MAKFASGEFGLGNFESHPLKFLISAPNRHFLLPGISYAGWSEIKFLDRIVVFDQNQHLPFYPVNKFYKPLLIVSSSAVLFVLAIMCDLKKEYIKQSRYPGLIFESLFFLDEVQVEVFLSKNLEWYQLKILNALRRLIR